MQREITLVALCTAGTTVSLSGSLLSVCLSTRTINFAEAYMTLGLDDISEVFTG